MPDTATPSTAAPVPTGPGPLQRPAELVQLTWRFSEPAEIRYALALPSGNCGMLSHRFGRQAEDAGFGEVRIVRLVRLARAPAPGEPTGELEVDHHYLTTLTDTDGQRWLVDWTARQFDPDAPCPRLEPITDDFEVGRFLTARAPEVWTVEDAFTLDQAEDEDIDQVARRDKRLPDDEQFSADVEAWGSRPWRDTDYAQRLAQALRSHAVPAPVLYRGQMLRAGERPPAPGEDLVLGLSSFSGDQRVAEEFSWDQSEGGEDDAPVLFEVIGCQALPISPSAFAEQREWLTAGSFHVAWVEPVPEEGFEVPGYRVGLTWRSFTS
jgi:hypothetical protein